jgi:hypothetical protein
MPQKLCWPYDRYLTFPIKEALRRVQACHQSSAQVMIFGSLRSPSIGTSGPPLVSARRFCDSIISAQRRAAYPLREGAPIPDSVGGMESGPCLPVRGASNESTLTFFEGENIVSPPQNRRVCDGLVSVLCAQVTSRKAWFF